MKFRFGNASLVLSHYLNDTNEVIDPNVIGQLNEYFKGWIWIDNPDIGIAETIFYVANYTLDHVVKAKTFQNSYTDPIEKEDILKGKDIKIRNVESETELYYEDIIYKIEPIEDEIPEKPPVIRWWKGGKFENLKTYEEFNEATRWYNKGKWEKDPEDKVPEYQDFITDDGFREFLIDNGIYDRYIKNSLNPTLKNGMTTKNFTENFDSFESSRYINAAFNWELSQEGHNYWATWSNIWMNH